MSAFPLDCSRNTAPSRPNRNPQTALHLANMFRTAILRSAAAATRAVRSVPSAPARRLAFAPAPKTASFVPRTVAWQAVRCYASGGSLDRTEVYERIKQLLSGFDKVRPIRTPRWLFLPLAHEKDMI